jgi:succinyl-diaminopimelate desuccinylase
MLLHLRSPRGFDDALACVRDTAETAVAELDRMIAVDTSFPPGGGYDAFAALMEELIAPLADRLGFATRRVAVPRTLWHVPDGPAEGERINLIAGPGRTPGTRGVCGLYFHVDTVPAAAGWTRPPFRLTREGDRLYGLGAADMKGSIAAVLLALRAAVACEVALAYDPMLLLCTDEEGGLYPGIRYLAEQGMLQGHVLNFNGVAAPRIWSGCFGMFNLRVVLEGRAAHAGDAGAAVNAIEASLPVLQALMELKPRVAARGSALPAPPHLGHPLSPLLTVAAANGGTGGSQLPGQFELTINRRYAPEEDFAAARDEIEAAIRAAAAQTPGLGVRIDLIGHLIPTADPTGPHWPRWQQALSSGFGYAPEEFRAWGASTCSDFGYVQKTGMQEILLGGLGRADRNIHAADEHTTLSDIVALAQSVLAYLAAGFAPDLIPESNETGMSPPETPRKEPLS